MIEWLKEIRNWRWDVLMYVQWSDLIFPVVIILWIIGKMQERLRGDKDRYF